MFLDRIRQSLYGVCNHPDDSYHVQIQDDGDRILCCRECGNLLSLRVYLCDSVSSFVAPDDAEEYVKWSGDDEIPCSMNAYPLRNRALTTRIRTKYSTLAQSCMLLRILHAPFVAKDSTYSNEPTPAGICFFQNTVQKELESLIERSSREKDDFFGKSVGSIAHSALVCVKNIFTVESKRYFDVLVPYVKLANPKEVPCYRDFHENLSLTRALERRLSESRDFHRKIAKCCAAFDAVHVATLCFLCRHDMKMVYDLVLDFASKLCRGYFSNDIFSNLKLYAFIDPLEFKIYRLLKIHVSSTSNTRIYRHLELLRKGGLELADNFSDTFFKTYWELKAAIVNELNKPIQSHFEWVFPRILFSDYSDYYAFLVALSYYSTETNIRNKTINDILASGAEKPGIISKCKKKYTFVKMSLWKVKAFHESWIETELQRKELKKLDTEYFELFEDDDVLLQKRYYWSGDMLKRFFECHPDFQKKWVDATEWLLKLSFSDNPDFERKSNLFLNASEFPCNDSFEKNYERYMNKIEDVSETASTDDGTFVESGKDGK